MILLWGLGEDAPLARVRAELARLRVPTLFLDQRETLECEVEVEFGPRISGRVVSPGGRARVEEVRGLYLRPYNFRNFPEFAGLGPGSDEWSHATTFEDIMWSWAEMAEARVLNRPSAMASNNSKPYQSQLIRECGFSVPQTLITTTAGRARRFSRRRGGAIYKSISGTRSIVSRVGADKMEALADVAWCPTQFQSLVEGVDYRVHVVGKRLFACRIRSDAVDYRYASGSQVEPCELPGDVAARCLALSERLGLELSGIDLRETPGGEWFCFEVNPSPAFSCFECRPEQTISAGIARYLAEAVGARVN
ncbi:MAG TPA: hypothetical protein VD861_15065 [Pyrinomonadaceae bacterium]|nr:hypothetical protein [Pyrinomonadaceae bacterium]